MSRQITQPVNQVRLTNVAVVRMNRHGKRFEIACYRNKILNYRQKVETDLSEVLQTDRIFTNVSKGEFASSKDLKKCFGTTNQEEIAKLILDKGDNLQISDLERSATLENTAREVAMMVSTKCVNPNSNRPYTVGQIREAMKEAEFVVQLPSAKGVKQQFLECVKTLKGTNVLPIERAKMELCVVLNSTKSKINPSGLIERLVKEANAIECQVLPPVTKDDAEKRISFLAEPSSYRNVDRIAKEAHGRLEVMRQVVTEEGDFEVNLEEEVKRVQQMKEESKQTVESESSDNDDDMMPKLTKAVKNTYLDDEDDDDVIKGQSDEQVQNVGYEPLYNSNMNSRKQNKKAQKKSKKAKRREKEELAAKEARLEAERLRREERASRLGHSENDPVAGDHAPSNDTKSCNTCGGSFSVAQYRTHFRSDWHRYNIKLKMKGIKPVSEKEFQLCDMDAFFDDSGGICSF